MKKYCAALIALTCALTLAGCRKPAGNAGTGSAVPVKPAEKFILLYDTGRTGDLVDCGCPSHPRGGLARLAAVAAGLAGANPGHFLHVDGGNSFFPVARPNVATDDQKRLAPVIARSFAHMSINAVNVGAMDLAAGLPFLRDQLARPDGAELPFVSANVLDPATGQPVFPASREFKVGNRNVCVFGVTEAFTEPSVKVSDPMAAARAAIADLKPKCDLIVGLYAMSLHAASELAEKVPGADVIVVSHQSSAPANKPLVLGNTILAQAGTRGMYAGRLDVTMMPTQSTTSSSISGEERAKVEAKLARVVAQEKILEGDINSDPQLANVYKKAKDDEKNLRAKLGQAAAGYEYENALISLDLEMPEEPQVAAWVKETGIQPRSHGAPATALPAVPTTPVAPPAAPAPVSPAPAK